MPFHCATENMAALLRSARLLKFSPSGLLQITRTKRNGPPLSRLYSGAPGGHQTGVCSRQIGRASENASSRAWPYAVGCVRNYTVATEQKDDTSAAVRSKQAQEFDWALTKLDSSVRRTGRITKTLLLRIFHDICRTGYPSGNQALLLLRSCGSLLPEVPLEERTELAHRVWEKLQELGAHYDVSHYNALLKVYLQNEFKFSPTEFLAKMEAANVQPNRVTYQRLIAAFCQNGNIEEASTILGFMKSKDLPISEAVFNSLVTGHARAGDMESAQNILTVMKGAGIEPGPDTYVSLLNAYAEKGDLDSLKQTLEAAESADCSLMDRDLMQVIFTLAKAGHQEHIPEIVGRLRHQIGYVPDAMNLCLSLITQGMEDPAFSILKTFPILQSDSSRTESANVGAFFLRHCVTMNASVEKLGLYCKELQESNMHSAPLSFTLSCALEAKKIGMSLELMKIMKEQGLPIRPHYFWPLLTQQVKDGNTAFVHEVLKGMLELGVAPDVETLSNYVIPHFPNMEAARQAIEEVGLSLESEGFLSSEVRTLAVNDLAKLHSLLSDPSFPSLDLVTFRGSLISGFRKSDDVESMVKITKLLYDDKRFCKADSDNPADKTSFFLYHLVESMSDKVAQAQKDKLQQYFSQLQSQNITISPNIYRGIKKHLETYNVPELIKNVAALVDPRDQDSGDSAPPRATETVGNTLALEEKLAELKAQNKPLSIVLKSLIHAHCVDENMQRALELKQQHEAEMTVGSYVTLMNLCCRQNNVEEALNLKRELSRKDSSTVLDVSKYITLIKALSQNDRVDDAVDILKEMKEKEVVIDDTQITTLFHMLSFLATKGNIPAVKQLQDTIFTLGLVKPTSNLCSPLITAYLDSKDLPGALEATMDCCARYGFLPRIHEIIVGLVEKGDTELLQKAMDYVSQKRGEMIMLYDLFFAFLQTGRYREARKIIETPGLRARPGRLRWFAERCITARQMEALEQMVDMTAKLFECDRDEMYSYVFRLCKETNDWQKAEAMWTKMQEENTIPRERTLRMLSDILVNNGQEVPFELSETWYKDDERSAKDLTVAENLAEHQVTLMALSKKGKVKDAYRMLMDGNKKGVALSASTYDQVIRALLAEGSVEEAMSVRDAAVCHVPGFQLQDKANSLLIITHSKKGQPQDALESLKLMLSLDQVPSVLAVTRLIQALGRSGDVAGIQAVETLIKDHSMSLNMSRMVFVNNMALAHVKNGELQSAVDMLEEFYTKTENQERSHSMSFVFERLLKEGNDEALDKLSAMAERLANHFACYRPASDLFIQLLEQHRVEEAKFMLARCNALAEQKNVLMSYLSQNSKTPGGVTKIKTLMSLVPDFAEKDILYSYLMKCHFVDKDLASAKALYEQMQKEGIVANELSLKRLGMLYQNEGETAPFPVPSESFKFYAEKLRQSAGKDETSAEE
uniref:leucine-rich PPR motif-containing protein, mitochondrial n=1 Tax=Scatophagus argus TaxID=75038 RepID=UPI001ED7F5D9|nr:leucine-rich PPR motif-containing protein, mitochondrial [Scatophagus argus]